MTKKYTEEQLIELNNKPYDDISREEKVALWEWLGEKAIKELDLFFKLLEEYPYLYHYKINEIAQGKTTLEEALATHGKHKYLLEDLRAKDRTTLTDEEEKDLQEYEKQHQEDYNIRLGDLMEEFPNKSIEEIYEQLDGEFVNK